MIVSGHILKARNTFFAGLLALLPLVITAAIMVWLMQLVVQFLGPDSVAGGLLAAVGLSLTTSPATAYALGALVFVLIVFCLGLFVQSKAMNRLGALLEKGVAAIPVVGQLYGFSSQFVGMLHGNKNTELATMLPVWVQFGDTDGAVLLALMPSSKSLLVEGTEKVAVIIPMSPVPVGGGLVFVPRAWVKPADISVEKLTSIYVSMGLTAPETFHGPKS